MLAGCETATTKPPTSVQPDLWAKAGGPELSRSAAAFAEQASELAKRDLPAARAKWAEARGVLEKTLTRDPNNRGAIYDFGFYLSEEAFAVATHDAALAVEVGEEAELWLRRASSLAPQLHGPINTAGFMWHEIAEVAVRQERELAQRLWQRARVHFQSLLDRLPDQHGAANNMGITYATEAAHLAPIDLPGAERLWSEAAAFYGKALTIKPDKANAMMNWANLCSDQAQRYQRSDWSKAQALMTEAEHRYAAALVLDPGYAAAAYSWGTSLLEWANLTKERSLSDARKLWQRAITTLRRTLELDRSHVDALVNISVTYSREAAALVKSSPSEAAALYEKSVGVSRLAAREFPANAAVLLNLGAQLGYWADFRAETDLSAARRLWQEADDSFAASWQARPLATTAIKWARMLWSQAEIIGISESEKARPLWAACYEKCALAERSYPRWWETHIVWGDALQDQAAQLFNARAQEAIALYADAEKHYAAAQQVKSLSGRALASWGNALFNRAVLVSRDDSVGALAIWQETDDKFAAALRLDPQHPNAFLMRIQGIRHAAKSMLGVDVAKSIAWLEKAVAIADQRRADRGLTPSDSLQLVRALDELSDVAWYKVPADPALAPAIKEKAKHHLRQLVETNPALVEAWLLWGEMLARETRGMTYVDGALSAEDAAEKFERAASLDPSCPGLALCAELFLGQADKAWWLDRDGASRWFARAGRVSERAVTAPNPPSKALMLHGVISMRLYGNSPKGHGQHFLDEAERILLVGEEKWPGVFAYNLACLHALRLRPEQCVAWLAKAQSHRQLPTRAKVESDSYLAAVADTPEFKAWLAAAF